MIDYIKIYHEFTHQVFDYLKRTILSEALFVRLNVIYTPYNDDRAGNNGFTDINIYLGKLISNFEDIRENKKFLLFCLIHEAFHELQYIDSNKYNTNDNYNNFVERNANYSTIIYINDHILELENEFNFKLNKIDIESVLDDLYNSKGGILLNKNNLDVKYFNKLVNLFFNCNSIMNYKVFQYGIPIYFKFILNNETEIYTYEIANDCKINMINLNEIISKFMYFGYRERIYNTSFNIVEHKDYDEIVFSIYMNNDKIKFMERV